LFARSFSIPMIRQNASKLILQTMGAVFGLISILGGIAAWIHGSSREPERYLVAAGVMLLGGTLWLVYSLSPARKLSKIHFIIIFVTLLLGLTLGFFYTFRACGGECGLGASYCRWEYGYPGRWYITGGCFGSEDSLLIPQGYVSRWKINGVSLLADIVFWCAAGLIIAFLWQIVSQRRNKALL
jgi:hypothetical protein